MADNMSSPLPPRSNPAMTDTDGLEPVGVRSLLFVMILMLFWAGNSVAMKVVILDLPPLWAGALRFAIGLLIMAGVARFRGIDLKVDRRGFLLLAGLGVLSASQIYLFNAGSQYTTAGRVTLMLYCYPVIVPFLAHYFLPGEKLSRWAVAGCVIAALGLLAVFAPELASSAGGSTLRGDFLELISSAVLGVLVVYNKWLSRTYSEIKILFWQMLIMIVLFVPAGGMFETVHWTSVRPEAWAWLAYQGVMISGFCFIGWQVLLRRHSSYQMAVYSFVTPLFGIVLGWLLLGEAIPVSLVLGGGLVGLGIYLVNR